MTHLIDLHLSLGSGLFAAAAAKKSSNPASLFIIVILFFAVYMLFLRPQRRKQQAALAAKTRAEVGDEVVTASGIYGTVLSFEGDRAQVEIAPGTTIEVAVRALGQRVDPVEYEDDEGTDEEGTGFGHPGYDGHDDLDDDEHDHDFEHEHEHGDADHLHVDELPAGDEPTPGGTT